ncbi:cobalamin biosynthesis protein CbiX [Paenibacillus sp. P96]|uniref:Cobalamin biosynthesis protein CbiX n=1 Tax=Paenibacillus zeirhizosphaerae TaxID=2987519 RepID=A0ABT9FM21_9BACL|nr:CbiX/SirB N-terminal domain-containing protein [Paenibacillus sp. P96]MDP4095774.1 cobalamin biosynthesis protein CbiX [Paenibacillus sp. P96]
MKPGVLIISHGSPAPDWVRLVDEVAGQLQLSAGWPVAVSFLEHVEGRLIQDGIDRLEEAGVTDLLAVPLFVSSGSTHVDEISYALGAKEVPEKETDLEPFRVQARVHFGSPIDDGPDVAAMVWDKVRAMSAHPEREVVLLVGHGSVHDGFRQRWERGMSSLAASVSAISGTACDYALLNPDSVRNKAEYWGREKGVDVIVSPLFLSSGFFTAQVIPGRLEGLDYRYSGEALLPHPLLKTWLERQISRLLREAEEAGQQ